MDRIKIFDDALKALTETPEVSAQLQKAADRVCADANNTLAEGEGYEVSSRTGRDSPPSSDRVYTATAHAMNSNAKHNTLLRVLNG